MLNADLTHWLIWLIKHPFSNHGYNNTRRYRDIRGPSSHRVRDTNVTSGLSPSPSMSRNWACPYLREANVELNLSLLLLLLLLLLLFWGGNKLKCNFHLIPMTRFELMSPSACNSKQVKISTTTYSSFAFSPNGIFPSWINIQQIVQKVTGMQK